MTPEDHARNRNSIQTAKRLYPDHDTVMLLEAEQLTQEDDLDGALLLLEKAKRRALTKKRMNAEEDATFVMTKGSVLTAKVILVVGCIPAIVPRP